MRPADSTQMFGLGRHDALFRFAAAIFGLYICVLPISGTTALRSVAFVTLALIAAWLWIRKISQPNLPGILIVAWATYGMIAAISLTYAIDYEYSAGEAKVEVLYGILILVIAATCVRSPSDLRTLVALLALGQLLFAVGSLATVAREGFQYSGTGAWRTGVGSTSTVIVTCLPWLFALAASPSTPDPSASNRRSPKTIALGLLLAVSLAALFLTMNRQAWIALAMSMLVGAVLMGRSYWTHRRLGVATLAGLAFILLVGAQFSLRTRSVTPPQVTAKVESDIDATAAVMKGDVRWQLWRFSAERIAEHPLSGGGFGRKAFDLQFRDYHLQSGGPLWHAHNMVINKGVQMGIPGIVAFLALWAAMAHAAFRVLRTRPDLRPWAIACLAMMAGVFMRNMTDDFFIRDHALMFWLLCGALLGAARQEKTP